MRPIAPALLVVFTFALAAPRLGRAQPEPVTLANPSFETGTTSGWTNWTNQNADAVSVQAGGSEGAFALRHGKFSAYQARTTQLVTGLPPGFYSLTAMVRNGGDQRACYLFAQPAESAGKFTSLPVTATWTRVIVRGIHVTRGRCVIGLWSDASAGQGCTLDDVRLLKDDLPYEFLQGGDLSELSYEESKGARYYDDGAPLDCLPLLRRNGFNFARLRAFVDPGNPAYSPSNRLPAGFQTTDDILSLARRAHAQGMTIQLTLNYSDYWADGSAQNSPHAWVGLSFADAANALSDYTYDIVHRLVLQGTPPAFVSLGNQMQSGLLLQPGNLAPVANWPRLAELLNRGSDAVKAASPSSRVMLHVNSPLNDGFFDQALANGVRFDVLGITWYPFWDRNRLDTLPQLLARLNAITARLDKDMVLMETAVNWSPVLSTGSGGQLGNNGNVGYPQTPAGQRDYLYDLFNTLKNVDRGRCLGVLYWDPVMVNQPGVGWELGAPNVVDNTTLFDWNHAALPSLKQAYSAPSAYPAYSPSVAIGAPPAPVAPGASIVLVATAPDAAELQWQYNGRDLPGASAATLSLVSVQPADTGLYSAVATTGITAVTQLPAILGLTTSSKVVGPGQELYPANVLHPNGNVFDQVLLTGPAAAITADYPLNQVTRTSYIDLDDDIVQVEYSGPGTLSLVLDTPSGPAAPTKYNQATNYMKGHAGLVITGATEYSNVSVFSVGRATAVNQALFKDGITYDGIADLAFIAIASSNGKFGGVRTANANYFATKGLTGLYAPEVQFTGPVYIGNISAFEAATPVILLGSSGADNRITGGDLLQPNTRPVQVSGLAKLNYTAGTDSHGNTLPARTNQAVLQQNGLDVTAQIVVNPAP